MPACRKDRASTLGYTRGKRTVLATLLPGVLTLFPGGVRPIVRGGERVLLNVSAQQEEGVSGAGEVIVQNAGLLGESMGSQEQRPEYGTCYIFRRSLLDPQLACPA
jgi:hypothetical protein